MICNMYKKKYYCPKNNDNNNMITYIHNLYTYIFYIIPRDCRNVVWFDRFDQTAAVGRGGASCLKRTIPRKTGVIVRQYNTAALHCWLLYCAIEVCSPHIHLISVGQILNGIGHNFYGNTIYYSVDYTYMYISTAACGHKGNLKRNG